MSYQETSLLAYFDVQEVLGDRHRQVLAALKELGSANNWMIAKKAQLPINAVTPRVQELRKKGFVKEDCKKNGPPQGRITLYWKLATKKEVGN